MFQEFDQLLPWKTVKQNIASALTASGKMKQREAEDRAIQFTRSKPGGVRRLVCTCCREA